MWKIKMGSEKEELVAHIVSERGKLTQEEYRFWRHDCESKWWYIEKFTKEMAFTELKNKNDKNLK